MMKPTSAMKNPTLPSLPGTYILVLYNAHPRPKMIGAIGQWFLAAGYYAYVGSAHGPGGLRSRIGRHVQSNHEKRSHWHIDALTGDFAFEEVRFVVSNESLECVWATSLLNLLDLPIPRFGSSDCSCHSHLFSSRDQRRMQIALDTCMAEVKVISTRFPNKQ